MTDQPAGEASLFLQLEPMCDAFEASWQTGSPPRIEDYLQRVTSAQQEPLLRELCAIDIEQRLRGSEKVSLAEYTARFPAHQNCLQELAQEHPEWKLVAGTVSEDTVNTRSVQGETNAPYRVESTKTVGPTLTPARSVQEPSRGFGDYDLLEEIGQGGMGVIYKARQRKLNRIVAIKMIRAGHLASASDIQRFQTEAEAIGQLEHPQIVPIYEVDEKDGIHFFSMAFVDGEDLSKKLRDGPLPPRQAAQLVHEIALAIHYAHQQGVIHRDLKPANILLTRDGQIRVTDFGLAKRQDADQGPTVTGDIVGTPGYMSPEQASGERDSVGTACDIYSLGAILYSLLTGRPPFQAATMIDTLMQVLDEPPVSPRQLNPIVDRDLETICLKCLEKVDVRRYRTAHDLSVELKRFLDGHPIQARPVSAIPRFWRWCCRRPKLAAAWSLIAGLLLFLGVAGPLAAIRQAHLKTLADEAAGQSEESARKYRREQLRANQEAVTANKQRQRADQQAQRAIRQELLATQQATVAEQGLYDTRMILAQAALKNADMRSMRQLLDFYQQGRAGKDYRGFEWYYLHEQLHQESLDIDANPGFSILDVAIRPGARQIASLGGNGFLRIWHPRTGKMIRQVKLGANRGDSMDYSDDGQWLAIGSRSGEIELRDADTLELGKKVNVGSVALSKIDLLPGHNKCVVRDKNGAILSVQLETGDVKLIQKAIVQSEYRNQAVYQQRRFACSGDGKYLAFNDSQQNVAYWDLELGKLKYLVKGTRVSTRSRIAPALGLSSDGQWLVHGDRRGEVSVWRASDGISYYRYHDHFKAIEQVVLTADNRSVVSAGQDRTIRMTELGGRMSQRVFHGHEAIVSSLAVASNNEFFVSADGVGTLKVFPLTAQTNPRTHDVKGGELGMAFHPVKNSYALSTSSSTIEIWNHDAREPTRTLTGHQGKVRCLTFHPQGQQLAAGLDDGTISSWNLETGEYLRELKGHEASLLALAYSPDGTRLASMSPDKQLKVWNTNTGKLVQSIPFIPYSRRLSWNPDGTRVVSATSNRRVQVFDVLTGKEVLQLPGKAGIYSPDGKHLVRISSRDPKTLVICDALTGKETGRLHGHAEEIVEVIMSADSRRVLSLDTGKRIAVWNMETNTQVLSIPVEDNYVGGELFIGAQGRTLAHLGNNVTIWFTGKQEGP